MITYDPDRRVSLRQVHDWCLEFDVEFGDFPEDAYQGASLWYWLAMRAAGKNVSEASELVKALKYDLIPDGDEWSVLVDRMSEGAGR